MEENGSPAERPAKAGAQRPLQPDYESDAPVVMAQTSTDLLPVSRRHARLNPNCVVCGARNPKGLHLAFHEGRDGVEAAWVPTEEWESFQGTVHGGIITTVLDEAMSKAVIARNWEALTVDLRVRFRGRVLPGKRLRLRGWVIEKQRRRILTEATLATGAGVERAHAWATFLVPRS
jgi:acyl-coenzyme A thioesterase PaaI-like protein